MWMRIFFSTLYSFSRTLLLFPVTFSFVIVSDHKLCNCWLRRDFPPPFKLILCVYPSTTVASFRRRFLSLAATVRVCECDHRGGSSCSSLPHSTTSSSVFYVDEFITFLFPFGFFTLPFFLSSQKASLGTSTISRFWVPSR